MSGRDIFVRAVRTGKARKDSSDLLQGIRDIHKPVRFTNISLGIVNEEVCFVCHSCMDEPDDWPVDQEWEFPLVQDTYPCATVRLVARLAVAPADHHE